MSAVNIGEYILDWKKILEPYIDNYLNGLIEDRKRSDPRIAELYEIFRDAGRGGKCIRGSLVKLGYELASGSNSSPNPGSADVQKILPASAAFEILQTAILGHDDVIDKSPLRRGRDSVWRAVERRTLERRTAEHRAETPQADAYHYGISQAICLGDTGIFLANRLIAESAFDPAKKIEALKTFTGVQLNTVDGEMLDVLMSYEKDYGDEDGVLKIASLKTAWYTVIGPLQLGAVLGGAGRPLLEALERFGMALGVAFQLRDDVLGIAAAEQDTGKSGTDAAEGKVTLLAHFAMKRASRSQLEELRRVYGAEDISEAGLKAVREIFESTGAFAETSERIEACLAEAGRVIPEITRDHDKAELLAQLCALMAQRKR